MTATRGPSDKNPDEQDGDAQAVDCSILVPILNEKADIASSVEAMRRQRFPGHLEFLLIDGGSSDGTREILHEITRADPRFRLCDNPRHTIPSGLNVGLREARGRWVARMDAHSEYPVDYLERGVERLSQGDVRWVSGPQQTVGRGGIGRATALALSTRLGRGKSRRWATNTTEPPEEYELDTGVFCGVWARDTLLEYGGWDERWDRNEDSQMAARFLERGEVLLCLHTMQAKYKPRESIRGLWRQYYSNGVFRAKTARWHPQTLRRSNLLAPAVVFAGPLAVFAPKPVRVPMRLALSAYGLVLSAAGVAALATAEKRSDALLVPAVLVVMHLAYGLGSLRGFQRHGWPLEALSAFAGLRLATVQRPSAHPVFAPSLK